MDKRKFPALNGTDRLYSNDTQRPRLRSPGIERYGPPPRRGLHLALAAAILALLAILLWRCA